MFMLDAEVRRPHGKRAGHVIKIGSKLLWLRHHLIHQNTAVRQKNSSLWLKTGVWWSSLIDTSLMPSSRPWKRHK